MERVSVWPLLAASVGLVVLAAILFTTPEPLLLARIPGSTTGEVFEARVVEVLEQGLRPQGNRLEPFARLLVEAEGGMLAGARLEVEERAIGATNSIRRFAPGDGVLLSYTRNADGSDSAYIVEYVRTDQLLVLAAAFVLAILAVGGLQGLSSLLGLAISFLVILRFIVPHILAGTNPIAVSVVGALFVQVATLYLSHGLGLKTTAGLLGTVGALVLTGLLGTFFIDWTRLLGLASEEASFISARAEGAINLQGLLLAGLIIGALGVLDDVAMSQASAVFELHGLNPDQNVGELFRRGMRIGRDHIAATVNTLFLAYAGASLPLLILLSTRPEPLLTLLNREFIAVEIVSTLVGSIGLIAAVPLTTLTAAVAARRQRQARPAHP